MGSPEEIYWKDMDVVNEIMHRLIIPSNSRSSVMEVLREVLAAEARSEEFDPVARLSNRGRQMLLKDFDENALILYNTLATGCGVPAAADILNLHRYEKHLEPISYSAISNFVKTSKVIERTVRKTKKSGKVDAESNWAKARVVQAEQMLKQLGEMKPTEDEVGSGTIIPVKLHGIVFWDEKHKEQVILYFKTR
jgi:hypothetical protein